MRKILRQYLPDADAVRKNRWLAPFQRSLLHPGLWHLNRRSAAGAVATGLFCGLIPGPLQMLGAAIGAVLFRVNLPLAMLCTLYTNPLTIVPLYLLAYRYGLWVLPGQADGFVPPPDLAWSKLTQWIPELTGWMRSMGKPLLVGLILLACTLAATGYCLTRLVWRFWILIAMRRRAGSATTLQTPHGRDRE